MAQKFLLGLTCMLFVVVSRPAAEEQLVRIKGKEARNVVGTVLDTLESLKTFRLELRKKRVSDFFEPVNTVGVVWWKAPMNVRWVERNPETNKKESVSVLSPETYMHYVAGLNTVEILDIKKHKDVEKNFKEYMQILQGGYDTLTKKYSFMVFALKKGDTPAETEQTDEKRTEAKQDNDNNDDEEKEDVTEELEKHDAKTEPSGRKKEEKEQPSTKFRRAWKKSIQNIRSQYGRDISEYRFKFKPLSENLKKEIVHINFIMDANTVIAKIIVAKADGDVIETDILTLGHINRKIKAERFDFEIPEGAEVKHLME